MPPSPATPTGISTRAASDPVAAIVRATWVRPGTTTVTVGTCPPPGPAPAPPAACSLPPPPKMTKAATRAAIPITAAMMMFRRRVDRSTTTSVSELEKLVSRFIRRILSANRNQQQRKLPLSLYYANNSLRATALRSPPVERLFLRTAAPLTRTRVVAMLKRAWSKADAPF